MTVFAALLLGGTAQAGQISAAGVPQARPQDTRGSAMREVMIPMRDGARLHTIILTPNAAGSYPILLNRTPYYAAAAVRRDGGGLPSAAETMIGSGDIVVIQDVRGKYGSEGVYVINRPLVGALNPTGVDHATDTYDTIDWLLKNLPQANGRVGISGTSYGGFLALMGTIDPHPALKVAAAIAPMVDTWRGDDWFHNGAFRQAYALDYAGPQPALKGGALRWRRGPDDYDTFLAAGSAHELAQHFGIDQLAFWKRLEAHPSYDSFWRAQALDLILARRPGGIATVYVQGLWDQEDIYGAVAAYRATRARRGSRQDHLIIGPWGHGGSNGQGENLGPLVFGTDTGADARAMVRALFDRQLGISAAETDPPPVSAFETGSNRWRTYDRWPPKTTRRKLYLQPRGALTFAAPGHAPRRNGAAFDEYVSDPARPVPYRVRPLHGLFAKDSTWSRWLTDDQRTMATRSDVLSYVSAPLTRPIKIAGRPMVELFASTSGTDADWVVKLIDVYPAEVAGRPDLASYQLPVGMEIFRGRYRTSPSHPVAIRANVPLTYRFALPTANHVFLPGHRIMVQVQSSWFPLYDRNPQTFVSNIFFARPGDYRVATQRVFHASGLASAIDLPVEDGFSLGGREGADVSGASRPERSR